MNRITNRPLFTLTSLSLLSLFCFAFVSWAFIFPFFIFSIATLALAGKRWLDSRSFDPYDLNKLRKLQEKEELRAAEEEHAQLVGGDIMCAHCGTVYDAKYPVCPNCRRSPLDPK